MDVMAMLVLAALLATAAPRYHAAMWSAGILIVTALVTLSLTPWDAIAHWFELTPRLPRAVSRLAAGATKALGAARTLLSPGVLLFGFLTGCAAWGLEGVGFFVLGSMFPAAHLTVSLGGGSMLLPS